MIALATCAELPDGDPDDAPLTAALAAEFVVWDDPGVDWSAYDRVVVRSTWDYALRRDEFLAWARSIGDRLINPLALIEWNTDKRYLGELSEAGIPTVSTTFVAPGGAADFPGHDFVVKPTVSAGSKDTARFGPGEHHGAQALLDGIHASGRTVMVQPYIASVDERGETALLYFSGSFSHAIQKGPLLQPGEGPTEAFFAPEEINQRTPAVAERVLADRVLLHLDREHGRAPTYARVDVVDGPGGTPLILELELTEPSLFLTQGGDEAIARFVAAVRAVR